jgi:uncharacterized protein (TIGR03067 family)
MTPEIKSLQGSWTVVAVEVEGQPMEGMAAQVVVKGDRFTTTGMGAAYEGRVTVDAAQRPKHFTLEFTEGPEKGNTNPGIYELEGDIWRICLNTRGGPRPAEFTTTPGSGLALETLQRGKAKPATPAAKSEAKVSAAPPQGEPAPELAGLWKMEAMVFNGRPLEKEYLPFGTREATAAEVTILMARQVQLKAAYRVDKSVEPHHMNYTLAHGPHKGKTQCGIYRLAGDGLETCFAALGAERPGEFRRTAGDGRTHTLWRRSSK